MKTVYAASIALPFAFILCATMAFGGPKPTIYLAGFCCEPYGSPPTACYWVNGSKINLADGQEYEANSIFVSGDDVHVTGSLFSLAHRDNTAGYWVNNVKKVHPGVQASYVQAFTMSGSTKYFLGANNGVACYWANEKMTELAGDGIAEHYVSPVSMCVSGGKVYAAGSYSTGTADVACYWINSRKIDLPGGTTPTGAKAESIFVSGGTVYVAGSFFDGTKNVACVWANGVKTDLPGGLDDEAKSVWISAGKVYVAGAYVHQKGEGGIACYWVDGVKTDLGKAAGANSIQVIAGDVYVAGSRRADNGYESVACCWVNGQRYDLPGEAAEAYSIFVK
jgi:hypothetical protein